MLGLALIANFGKVVACLYTVVKRIRGYVSDYEQGAALIVQVAT